LELFTNGVIWAPVKVSVSPESVGGQRQTKGESPVPDGQRQESGDELEELEEGQVGQMGMDGGSRRKIHP
jgi:hypothetical protein